MSPAKKRVLDAIGHNACDRVPVDFWSTAETDAKLMRHFNVNNRMELLDCVGADIVYIDGPEYTGKPLREYPDGSSDDVWGVRRQTCFVGEGDDYYDGDSILVNDQYLSNSESPWYDVWNSASPEIAEDGIDIDTFYITWSSGAIDPGDTSAQVDLPTETDSWNLIYIILCFRSDITTGGPISYLVR